MVVTRTERLICSAYQSSPPERPTLTTALFPTGRQVHSITTSIGIYNDSSGQIFFVKPITTDQNNEPAQLVYLDSVGIPTPQPVLVDEALSLLATPYSGETLSSVLGQLDTRGAERLLRQVGGFLSFVHQTLNAHPPSADIVSRTYGSTAHIVDNFFYKHLGITTATEYRDYKDPLSQASHTFSPESWTREMEDASKRPFIPGSPFWEPALQRLVNATNVMADCFMSRLRPFRKLITVADGAVKPVLDIPDRDFFEGDFKPDNILVSLKQDPKDGIVIIDPVISHGSIQFDLAKFAGRFLIGRYVADNQDLLAEFFKGYGEMPDTSKPQYGPLDFVDLVRMDTLNAFRSYVKRYIKGERQYHLVDMLGSEEFCQRITLLIEAPDLV